MAPDRHHRHSLARATDACPFLQRLEPSRPTPAAGLNQSERLGPNQSAPTIVYPVSAFIGAAP